MIAREVVGARRLAPNEGFQGSGPVSWAGILTEQRRDDDRRETPGWADRIRSASDVAALGRLTMGDYTYTRFSIPLSAVGSIQRRRVLAAALGTTMDQLAPVFDQDPTTNEPTAGHANDTALRLVEGVPCLVVENDACNFGGSFIEDDLQEARIPVLRFHLDGNGYGPGRAAFTGSGDLHWVDCDQSGTPVVCVVVVDGKAAIDPDSLVLVDDLLAAEHAVLHFS